MLRVARPARGAERPARHSPASSTRSAALGGASGAQRHPMRAPGRGLGASLPASGGFTALRAAGQRGAGGYHLHFLGVPALAADGDLVVALSSPTSQLNIASSVSAAAGGVERTVHTLSAFPGPKLATYCIDPQASPAAVPGPAGAAADGEVPQAITSLAWGAEGGSQESSLGVQLGPRPPSSSGGPERDDDYYANVGTAVRTLREDIPGLFGHELDWSLYTEDVAFRDPRNTFVGIDNYRLIFWSLRFHGAIFFSRLYVDVHRIWQDPSNDNIKMRWTVHGIPRVPWHAEGTFDGISTYRLDRHGKIFEHQVDNVILRDPPVAWSPLFAGLKLSPMQGAVTPPMPRAW